MAARSSGDGCLRRSPGNRDHEHVRAEASPLASFIPARLAQYLGEQPDAPSHRRARGVALYTDIAGSCALADRLASRHGAAGVDELSRVLNRCFSVLIDIIEQAGGEIVQFAGDAMLVVWIADDDTLESAVHAAMRAAGALSTVRAREPELAALGISLRTGVGAGDLLAARVGGPYDRWEFVVAGGAVSDAFRAMSIAPAGGPRWRLPSLSLPMAHSMALRWPTASSASRA